MQPLFSICIPTYNRAELLEYCLEQLRELERFRKPFEIVVSDNASTDDTRQRVEAKQAILPYLRYSCQRANVGAAGNYQSAIRKATGKLVIYLADDDSIIPENLIQHIARMEGEPDLAAVYTDWIAYDDDRKFELHRYFHFDQPVSFDREHPLELINFIFTYQIYPEIAVYRRAAFLQAFRHVKHSLPFHLWMYRLSRLGRIAFELMPFYRENRVLNKQFRRTHWANMELNLSIIGDEQRNALESLLLLAFQDAGFAQVPDDQAAKAKQMIDRFLHARVGLEVQRAIGAKNWILALELRQRHILWYGPGSLEEQKRDVLQIAFPAALQAVSETYQGLSDVDGLLLRGFQSNEVHGFFRAQFPKIPLVAVAPDRNNILILYREAFPEREDTSGGTRPGYVLYLDQLLETYRVGKTPINLSQL